VHLVTTPTSTADLTGTLMAPEELRRRAEDERTRPHRTPGIAARLLFTALDTVYGRASSLEKFRVLEVVARVPYQAWEQVAFVAVTHTHGDPQFARSIHERATEARAQQDNEMMHLLMIEELLDRQGVRHSPVRGVVLPQVLAFFYYQLSWLLYVVRPRWSYGLNADFEDHATHTYLDFVHDHPELDEEPWVSTFAEDYGHSDTVGELFRRIALDEAEHRAESERRIHAARFGDAPSE
jgi:hypothetical protein